MKIIKENTQILTEDKVVKFNGEMFPKFGWAVILMGGGGSGKGSAYKKLIPIEGKYMNIDDLKENPKFWDIVNRKSGMTYKQEINGRIYDKSGGKVTVDDILSMGKAPTISVDKKNKEGRDKLQAMLKDPSHTENIHQALKPLNTIIKQDARDAGKYANPDRLKTRGRSIPEEVLLKAHRKVINTARELFASPLLDDIDNFWVINTLTPNEIFSDDQKYHDFQNVFKIPTTPDGFETFLNVFKETNKMWNQSWKTGKNSKVFEPAKPFNIRRRMNQQSNYLDKKLNAEK